jgi:hypothetical protein
MGQFFMNDGLENIWKEAVDTYCEALFLPRGSEKTTEGLNQDCWRPGREPNPRIPTKQNFWAHHDYRI